MTYCATLGRWVAVAVAAVTFAIPGLSQAGVLTFGQSNDFESQTPGGQPAEFHDGDTSWYGEATVVASGTDGVTTNAGLGGNQFLKAVAGPEGSYQVNGGWRNGPFGHVGAQQPNPSPGGGFSVFGDLYTKAAVPGESGHFWWSNGINNINTGQWLTEHGFVINPGENSWEFQAKTLSPTINLAVDSWYTLETIFRPHGSQLKIIHNIYNQGDRQNGTAIFSQTAFKNINWSDVGGPKYSWFTVWDKDTVDAIYVDNVGTAAVPEPASIALLSLGTVGGIGLVRRRRRHAAKSEK